MRKALGQNEPLLHRCACVSNKVFVYKPICACAKLWVKINPPLSIRGYLEQVPTVKHTFSIGHIIEFQISQANPLISVGNRSTANRNQTQQLHLGEVDKSKQNFKVNRK